MLLVFSLSRFAQFQKRVYLLYLKILSLFLNYFIQYTEILLGNQGIYVLFYNFFGRNEKIESTLLTKEKNSATI